MTLELLTKILDWPNLIPNQTIPGFNARQEEALWKYWGKKQKMLSGYQHFLLFPQFLQWASYSGLLKVGIVWLEVKEPIVYQVCLQIFDKTGITSTTTRYR